MPEKYDTFNESTDPSQFEIVSPWITQECQRHCRFYLDRALSAAGSAVRTRVGLMIQIVGDTANYVYFDIDEKDPSNQSLWRQIGDSDSQGRLFTDSVYRAVSR